VSYRIESLLIALCALITLNAQAVSFTADAVHMRGPDISHAKMFWKDGNVRFEYMDQGVRMVQIFDNSKHQMIWLDTESKVYVQRELGDQQKVPTGSEIGGSYNPCDEFPGAECRRLKTAEVNGRQTDKWLITFAVDGRDQHVFQWVDKQHRIVVRQENPDGSVLDVAILDDQEFNGRKVRKVNMVAIAPDGSTVHGSQWYDTALNIIVKQQVNDGAIDELRNIKVENIEPEMFAIPEGYESIESELTELSPESVMTFGTADQQ
jgi:hypothetical protein